MKFLLLLSVLFPFLLQAQDTTTSFKESGNTMEDSLIVEDTPSIKAQKDTTHSPKKAALLSLLPGAGQIYNSIAMPKGKKRAYWEVPIIYAGLGVTAYFAIKNQIAQKTLKEEYNYRIKHGHPNPNLQEYINYDNQGILELFKQKRNSRDLMIFAFVAVYGLNILEAYVEAHFIHFDISKDLTMSICPSMHDFYTPGISLSLKFR